MLTGFIVICQYRRTVRLWELAKNKKQKGVSMPIKVSVLPSKAYRVAVRVKRPSWQKFLNY